LGNYGATIVAHAVLYRHRERKTPDPLHPLPTKSFSGSLLAQSKRFVLDSWKLLALGLWQQQSLPIWTDCVFFCCRACNFMLQSIGAFSFRLNRSEGIK